MDSQPYDVVVIGGGIVGCSIVRALTLFDLRVALVEREPDICEGTSKANSAIVCSGFDARPGTLEARLILRSRELWPALVNQLHIPFLDCGALMLVLDDDQERAMQEDILPTAAANGVPVRPLSRDEVLGRAPYLSADVRGGLWIPQEAITDPFQATAAYAEDAVLNGADFFLGEPVVGLESLPEHLVVRTGSGRRLTARYAVNAAGLWSDEIARLAGDDSFRITPRRGEFVLVEANLGIDHILLPVPTPKTKGILVTPVIFGGILLGPTADDIVDKHDRSTTSAGQERVRTSTARMVPALAGRQSLRQFAGVRAVGSEGDYIIRRSAATSRLVHVAGIRSTGVSASPGIAEHVLHVLTEAGLDLGPLRTGRTTRADILAAETNTGCADVICLCRSVTRQEILRVLDSRLPPQTLDGLKRRSGAMLGHCQGNVCIPQIMDIMAQQSGRSPTEIVRGARGSALYLPPARSSP